MGRRGAVPVGERIKLYFGKSAGFNGNGFAEWQ